MSGCPECGRPDGHDHMCSLHPDFLAGNLAYLREKYAVDFITIEELEEGLESVLRGGPVNVPKARP